MALPGWRDTTVQIMAEKVGPVAEFLVDDAMAEVGISERDMTAAHFLQFIRLLQAKLPSRVNRRALCQEAQDAVLKKYGFGKP